jgi:c-di-GMP-related signal transduction protein
LTPGTRGAGNSRPGTIDQNGARGHRRLSRQTLADVRKRGFRLAFDDQVLAPAYTSAGWRLASFIKIDISRFTQAQLLAMTRQTAGSARCKLIAEKVESAEQFEARQSGWFASLFQGYWFARPVMIQGAEPATRAGGHHVQLINLVRKQASTSDIEDIFKR